MSTSTTTTHPDLRAAILHLAGHCDGALAKDFEGFSKPDAAYGARMAEELAARDLDAEEQSVIRELLVKYRATQLEPAGLKIPSPRDLAEYLGEPLPDGQGIAVRRRVLGRLRAAEYRRKGDEREARRVEIEAREKEARRSREEGPHVFITAGAGNAIEVRWNTKVSTHPAILEAVRKIEGRRFVPGSAAYWTVPDYRAAALLTALSQFRTEVEPAIEEMAEACRTGEKKEPPRITFTLGDPFTLWIEFGFGRDFDLIKEEVKRLGARWGGYEPRAHWTLPADRYLVAQAALGKWTIAISDDIQTAADAATEKLREAAAKRLKTQAENEDKAKAAARERALLHSRVIGALGDLTKPIRYGAETRTLFEHQRTGVSRMLEECFKPGQRGCINADQTGLGKSTQAMLCASGFQRAARTRVVILCPVSVVGMWKREAAALGVKVEVYSWAKVPKAADQKTAFIVIADEAHNCSVWGYRDKKGNIKGTQRTVRFMELCEKAAAVFPLTATPMRNGRPRECFPMLRVVGHALGKNRREYDEQFCDLKETRFSKYDNSGAANMMTWHELTRDVIVRREKRDCLDLPPLMKDVRDITLTDEAQAQYVASLSAAVRRYHDRLESGEISVGGEALVLLGAERLASSTAKVEAAIELADEILAEKRPVVLFTEFKESAATLSKRFGVGALNGEMPQPERQAMIDAFQAGRQQVFIGTIRAGGAGVDLQTGSDMILVDPPLTHGDFDQVVGRIERIGQRRSMTVYCMLATEIDRKVFAMVTAKGDRVDLLLKGKRQTLRGVQGLNRRQMAELLVPYILAEDKGKA